MPMIDVYSAAGTFADKHSLARDVAACVMRNEQVPDLALFRNNTAGFVHELPVEAIANVAGEGNYVRVQVLTPVGVLDREKQLSVSQGTDRDHRSSGRRPKPRGTNLGPADRVRLRGAGGSAATQTRARTSPRRRGPIAARAAQAPTD